MGDTHPRTMEGNWGQGNDVSWPVECLLNGMNTSDHLMYNNGSNHSHVISSPFRHRFQTIQTQTQQGMHLSAGLPLSSSINVSIPSHPMVEESVQNQEMNNGTSVITGDNSGQDRHNVPQPHSLSTTNVLDDTDDGSDDEDEDEVDDELMLSHRRSVSLAHPHSMDENSMVSCQQQVPVRDNLNGMMSMSENHCHQKIPPSVILRNGVPLNEHSLQHHSHQQHPHSMMPIFPQMDDFGQNESQMNQGSNDPNSGYSVYGKMYFEGRIVLHLKQGNYPEASSMGMGESGGMNFAPCGESDPHKGQHFQGCAACRLRSPLTEQNHRRHRDSHRHTIRGVLFTFEDCTIVELYPDQLPSAVPTENPNGLKPGEDSNKMTISTGQPMPMNSYLAPPSMVQQQESTNPKQRSMQQMQIDPINMPSVNNPQSAPSTQHIVKPHNQTQEPANWWAEFESDADGENEMREAESTEEESNQGPNMRLPSCMNEKLNASCNNPINHLPSDQHMLQETRNEEDQELRHSDDETCSQYVKYKCNICPDEFVSRNQLDSHICLSHSLNQNHNGTTSLIPEPGIELDLSSSSNSRSNTTSFDNTNTPDDRVVTTPTMTDLEVRNEISSGNEDNEDCHSGLNIAISGGDDSCSVIKPDTNILKRSSKKTKLKHHCESCNKMFSSKKTLKSHVKVCQLTTIEKDISTCTRCNIELVEGSDFQEHSCPFVYLQSSVETPRKRKVKPMKNKLAKKLSVTKRKKTTAHSDNTLDLNGKISKNVLATTGSCRNMNSTPAQVHGKTRRRRSTSTRLNRLNFSAGQAYNSEEKSMENQDDSISRENDNEDHSVGSSNNCNSTGMLEDGSDSSGSSHEDEYEDQTELESQSVESDHNALQINRGAFKKKRKQDTQNEDTLCHVENNKKFKRSRRIDKSSQCEKCGKRFARKDKLMRHMYVHNEEKMFVCHICEKRFSRRDKLSDHLKSHGSDEIHHCPMCKKEFLRPDILKQHVKLHGMGNKHQCPDCLRFVTGKDRLEKHMTRHEEAKALGQTLLCPLCTKYFIQRQSLKAHIKKFHPNSELMDLSIPTIPASPPDSSVQQPLTDVNDSQEVDKESTSLNTLDNRGLNTPAKELNEKITEKHPYACNQCPKQFAKRLALKKHQRKHTNDQALNTNLQEANGNDGENCGQEAHDSRQALETQVPVNNPTSSTPLSHCNILLSLASQMHMVSSSPLSTRSISPTNALESTPSPAHTVLPTQHPPTPPLSHLPMNSIQHHHPNHLASISSTTNVPSAHIPLSLAAANVSSSQSMSTQQSNIIGISGQGLHGHPSHILHHAHHSNAPGLSHPNLSCSHGQMHANLTHHLPMSPLQHMNVGMTQQFSYYHYSYQ